MTRTTPQTAERAVALPHWSVMPMLALFAAPAAAEAGNAVVIDFDQGRLILSWLGLWLVAALTFMLCADKRIRLMTRLADHLGQRAQQRAMDRADAAMLALAQDDPRILVDLRAAIDVARASSDEATQQHTAQVEAAAAKQPLPLTGPKKVDRPRRSRSLRVAPMPGMPHHLQYLPG